MNACPTAGCGFLVVLLGLAAAQQPPRTEEEDPKAKKPSAAIDIESFPAKAKDKQAAPKEPPGVVPGRGTLVIGVRALPERVSPARARSDAARWALDLVFDGLLRPAAT